MRSLPLLLITTATLWSLTLDEALERALQHSPTIAKAQSNLRYAQTVELDAQAPFHPTLDAGFNWQDADKSTAFTYTPSHQYNLTAKYNLFNGFVDKSMMDAAASQTAAQQLLTNARKSDLKLDVLNAYTGTLKAQKAVETMQQAFDALTRSYEDANIRYEQGMMAKNELLMIDVQKLSSEQALAVSKSRLLRAYSHLNRLLGGTLEINEPLEDITANVSQPEAFEELLSSTYAQRSELQALHKYHEALAHQHRAAGSLYPSVDLQADYIINDKERLLGTTVIRHKELLQTTVSVSWNLYNGRRDEALRKGILEQMNAYKADIAAMKLDLRSQLRDAYESYNIAKSAKSVAARAKESAQENYRITNDRYTYGEVDTLTLLMSQSDLTAARNAYNNAYYDLYAAAAALERISGE